MQAGASVELSKEDRELRKAFAPAAEVMGLTSKKREKVPSKFYTTNRVRITCAPEPSHATMHLSKIRGTRLTLFAVLIVVLQASKAEAVERVKKKLQTEFEKSKPAKT